MQEPNKGKEWEVIREVSRTYVFFQGLNIVFQAYQGSSVKASSTRQDPASLMIPRRQLLKRLGLQGSGFLHPIQGKAVQSRGYKVGTANLEKLAFPPREGLLEEG